jgi:beta-barrel assembly-enhancing protease
MRATIASLAIVGLLISGCATLPAAPDADEHALAARADKEEETFLKRATVYVEPLLVGYLAAVADRLTPGFRLIVLRDPTLNAFALPNRHVFLHTGLLSRVENESQLAMIIAREMAHVTAGHARATARDGQPARVVYTTVDEPTANAMLGSGLVLSARAAITGYGSDLERDADVAGMESVMRVGYDARQAPAVFARLRSDLEERGPLEVFYFGSSARLTERIETTEQLLKTRYAHAPAPSTMVDTEPFQLRMRSVVRENAYEDIRAGRFSLAQRQLDRVLAQTPNDPVAHMYAGDLHRLRAQRAADAATRDQDARLALAAYEKAVELDPTAAEPHRQLGFLYYQQKDNAKARAAFERYLALQPTGLDAKRVREYLAELTRSR